MSNNVLMIGNRHSADCGTPPGLKAGDTYTGYFENSYGEQWVVQIDRQKREGVLRGGDLGWAREVRIVEGVCDVVLSDDERTWLDACWRAATGEPLRMTGLLDLLQQIPLW